MSEHLLIERIRSLLDEYHRLDQFRMGVARMGPGEAGVPAGMQDGAVNDDGWVRWRMVPSTVAPDDVAEVETRFGIQLPPSFRCYLQARAHLYDQVRSRLHQQQLMLCDTPADHPLEPVMSTLTAWSPLIRVGYIPFAQFGDGWGPICFDIARKHANGECHVVWFDHEFLAGMDQADLSDAEALRAHARPLYDSFIDLVSDVFGP
jgi:hypothetical protein